LGGRPFSPLGVECPSPLHRAPHSLGEVGLVLYGTGRTGRRQAGALLERHLAVTAENDGRRCRIRIPQDPGGAGKFQASRLVKMLAGFTVDTERETTSKENRADPFASQCEQGHVKLHEASWNQAFIDELCAFPMGSHD